MGKPLKGGVAVDSISRILSASTPIGAGAVAMSTPNSRRPLVSEIVSPGQLEYEYTVRGQLHWLGVMTDWHWEGMSSTIMRLFRRVCLPRLSSRTFQFTSCYRHSVSFTPGLSCLVICHVFLSSLNTCFSSKGSMGEQSNRF